MIDLADRPAHPPQSSLGQLRTIVPVLSPSAAGAVLVVAAAGIAGTAVVAGPLLALLVAAVPLAFAGVLLAVSRPAFAVVVVVGAEVSNLGGVLGSVTPVSIFHVTVVLGAAAAALALRSPDQRSRLNRVTGIAVALVAVALVGQLLAMWGSESPELSSETVLRFAADCLFLVVVLVLAQLAGRPWAVAAAVVLPLALLSGLALVNQVVLGGTASFGGLATVTDASGELTTTLRHAGPLPDSNFWGRHLVLGLPLACALASRAIRRRRRSSSAGWITAIIAILAGIYLTQSRGTFLAAALAVVVWVIASGPTARRRGLLCLPLVAPMLLLPGIGDRFVAVVQQVAVPGATVGTDPSVLGRTAAQEIAWAMFDDKPVLGWGPGTYPSLIPQYAGDVATAVLVPTDAPHNLYAELAGESGVVGLVAWLLMIGGFVAMTVAVIVRLAGRRATLLTEADRFLTAGVLAAVVAWSFASVFLHLAYFRTFAVVLALAAAIAGAVMGSPGETGAGAVPGSDAARRGLATALAATVAAVAAAVVVLLATATPRYTASQMLTLVPPRDLDGYYAYALDIRSRDVVLPTYATIMAPRGGTSVGVAADPVRGVMIMSATGHDEVAARSRLDAGLTEADRHLRRSGAVRSFVTVPVGQPDIVAGRQHSIAAQVAAGLAGAAAAALAVLGMRYAPHRRRHDQPTPNPTGGVE
jgi:O-antigen ligase